jgi:sucrose-phosphate synthase
MHICFLNPQGNFDPADSHLTEHPDFGGQLVYVKEISMALTRLGHRVDIVTRRVVDPEWPEFSAPLDYYPGYEERLRIVRVPCGGDTFLAKEQLWEHMPAFVAALVDFYAGDLPDIATAHYGDGGYCGVLLQHSAGLQFTFTGHSLGAQKLDKLGMNPDNAAVMEARYRFSTRIAAERLSMQRAVNIITSTRQEHEQQYSHPLYQGAVDVGGSGFRVIPPGVNTEIFTTAPGDPDAGIAERLHTLHDTSEPYIIVSSRLDEKKNIIGVVRAYAADRELQRTARLGLFVRGVSDPFTSIEGLPEQEIQVLQPILDTIAAAGVRDRVRFFDIRSQRELAATYRVFAGRGSVFALTAFYEPFGLAPIEAAACGLAVVATSNGGPAEIFADGSGVLVDPTDSEAIGRGLREALQHAADYAARGIERVLTTYTWDKTAEGYAKVLTEALANPASSAETVPDLDAAERLQAYLAS